MYSLALCAIICSQICVTGSIQNLSQSQREFFSELVKTEKRAAVDKLFNETINYEDFLLSGTGTAALADSIIAAYLGQKSLSLGIWGSPASKGHESWPYLLSVKLQHGFQIQCEVHNHASNLNQVLSAATLGTFGGSGLDILFWEFGMDAMDSLENFHLQPSDNAFQRHPVRSSAAEVWIREAILERPAFSMFLHLWDSDISTYDVSGGPLPNKAWAATNQVMQAYEEKYYNAYISLDIIASIAKMKPFTTTAQFLEGGIWPNPLGQSYIADMVYCSLLHTLSRALTNSPSAEVVSNPELLRNAPLVTLRRTTIPGDLTDELLPNLNTRPYLWTPSLPTSSILLSNSHTTASILLCTNAACGHFVNVTAAQDESQGGLRIPTCSDEGGTGGVYLQVRWSNAAYLLIDCGGDLLNPSNGSSSSDADNREMCRANQVTLDGVALLHNTDIPKKDLIGEMFPWAHKFPTTAGALKGEPGQLRTLRICGQGHQRKWEWRIITGQGARWESVGTQDTALHRVLLLEGIA